MAQEVTRLLQDLQNGRKSALDELLPVVYDELRCVAHRLLEREYAETLPTTALVHEAYLKLAFRVFRQQIKNQLSYSVLIRLSPSDESFVDQESRLIMRWRAVKPNI